MNGGLLTLWIIVIILIIIFIVLNILTIITYKNTTAIVIPTGVLPCSETHGNLTSISDLKCCVISGTTTQNKYFPDLNLVVNPNPIYYLDVCKNFCVNGYNELTNSCFDDVGLNDFNNCVKASQPTDCIGVSKPVAISGLTYYYPYSATNNICLDQVAC